MGQGAVVSFYLRTRVLILMSHQGWAHCGAHPEGQLSAKRDGLEDRRNRRRNASDLTELRRHKNVTGNKITLLDLAGPPCIQIPEARRKSVFFRLSANWAGFGPTQASLGEPY